MTAISESGAPRDVQAKGGLLCLNVRGGAVMHIYPGALIGHRVGSQLAEIPDPDSPRADLIIRGYAANEVLTVASQVDGDDNALDADGNILMVNVEPGIGLKFDTGAGVNEITKDHIGQPAFAFDDNTLYATSDFGTLSPAGIIKYVDDEDYVALHVEDAPQAWAVFGDADVATASASAAVRTVRGVVVANVASLAAFTVADNGITYVEGDRVLLAAQTTALQCGIYVVGEVDAGSAALTRAADMPVGVRLPFGTTIEVGPGNTEYANSSWKSTSTQATGALIGTHDPAFYPRNYRQTITLAAGTYTIGFGSTATPDEALFLLAGASVQVTQNTPNTTTSTTEYCAPSASRVTGKPGTAVVLVRANVAAGTINVADLSTLDVLVSNW